MIRRVAASDATVLITGESGTGKELVARALHQLSPTRREAPFVAINCGAMPASLLESELFGHVRGAFTDARSSRAGLFVQAGAGTILLDEIGEMPLDMQAKLLRVLQQRTVRPVGADEEMPFEARVVAATNRDLETEVEEGRFRERPVPPDRRRHDRRAAAARPGRRRAACSRRCSPTAPRRARARSCSGITRQAAQLLVDYDWPGNVRELENCIERAVALCRGDRARGVGPADQDRRAPEPRGSC